MTEFLGFRGTVSIMRRLSTLAVILSLLVAACADSSMDTTTILGEETTTTVAVTTTSTDAGTTTAPEEDTTTTSGETAEGTDDCVVGAWVLDNAAFVEDLSTFFEEAGMTDAEISALDGDYTVEMSEDGSFTGTRESWGFVFETEQGNFTIELNGIETGTWSADGSTLSVENRSSDLDIYTSVESGGQEVELPQGQFPIETPEGIASNSQYHCSGDVLTLTNSGIESTLNRS